ncbi:MAG: FAD-dependent oxidoreductase [Oscillospiraceae bacterium]|nr:FAD-dependent oxidoreductase [Oscillospiraceae bacterium]
MRILVIGGVAAGAGAATKARRVNEEAEIVLFEKGSYVSFANCGLPYYIGGVIEDRDELLLVTPELFRERFNIDVRINSEVTKIDPKAKTITVKTGSRSKREPYDRLIIATGGTPVTLPVKGAETDGVYHVFTLPDADRIMSRLELGMKRAVVVGGGFIGLESAENLRARGLEVTVVEKLPQVMSNMDGEFSDAIIRELEAAGIRVLTGVGLAEITGRKKVTGVVLDDGTQVKADMVIMAAGVRGSTQLAEMAGCRLGATGGVWVDASMRTSVPDIYAAGDMVESLNLVTGKKVRIPLAGSANKQGRVAGANAAGGHMTFKGVLGTAIIKVGGLTAARTGLSAREAEAQGYDFECVYAPGFSNATYYPDAMPLLLKLTVERQSGRLLGAQGIGRKGVDKRIDVLATAIYGGMTVFDLEDLDLAYAPPFSSAKDPVILGGMIASNVIRGEIDSCLPSDIPALLADKGTVVLDVRTQEEWDEGHVEGAVLLPVDELRARYAELDPKKTYAVYCGVGYRAYNACLFLKAKGYRVMNVSGGMRAIRMGV